MFSWLSKARLHYSKTRTAEFTAMKASLSARELAVVTVGGWLSQVLARRGAALDAQKHESQPDAQPFLHVL
ncbi:hypothetical protein JW805_20750 [Roseomonas aeriglobus]|nr:hypothetical protein [Roseomonas aeriglobus]